MATIQDEQNKTIFAETFLITIVRLIDTKLCSFSSRIPISSFYTAGLPFAFSWSILREMKLYALQALFLIILALSRNAGMVWTVRMSAQAPL